MPTAAVLLDDGANVSVASSGSFAVGDRHYFSIGAGALRLPLDKGPNSGGTIFCRDCHSAWAVDENAVHSNPPPAGKVYSHPVGMTLNAGGRTYDRATPLDGNGTPQGSHTAPAAVDRDANPSNDLKLASDGTVQCFSCHGVHHADSNTRTVDAP